MEVGLSPEIDALDVIFAVKVPARIVPGVRTDGCLLASDQRRAVDQARINLSALPVFDAIDVEAENVGLKSGAPFNEHTVIAGSRVGLERMRERDAGSIAFTVRKVLGSGGSLQQRRAQQRCAERQNYGPIEKPHTS